MHSTLADFCYILIQHECISFCGILDIELVKEEPEGSSTNSDHPITKRVHTNYDNDQGVWFWSSQKLLSSSRFLDSSNDKVTIQKLYVQHQICMLLFLVYIWDNLSSTNISFWLVNPYSLTLVILNLYSIFWEALWSSEL